MKTLVTGATGFVGSHVVRKLVAAGHQVRILKRPNSKTLLLEGLEVETAIGDVTDRDSVRKAVAGCEVVFHVAGHVSFWGGHREVQNRINVNGTRNVVMACLEQKAKRLVHTSSVAAIGYSPTGRVLDETQEFNWWPHRINYCNSKFLAEEEVREGVKKGLDAVMVNPGVIFGPGDMNFHGGGMVYLMAKGRIPVYFDGGCSTCDVEDVADGHLAAMEKGRSGERYILAGENHTWKSLFGIMAHVVGVRPPRWYAPTPLLLVLAYSNDWKSRFTGRPPTLTPESVRVSSYPVFFTSAKAQRELGYRPRPLRESLARTYEWYRGRVL